MKKLFLILCFLSIIFFLGRSLNPFSSSTFTFHDSTQPVRIQQFVKELKSFHIPPRVAADMNFGLGFPVFNFYAPFSYWITSFINIIGFDIIDSIKLSFFLALIFGFFGCYFFLKHFFGFFPSFLGGFLYITSLYFPLNIFVRGNLAETWFLAILPLAMSFLLNKNIFASSMLLFFLFTSHNILSLISIPLILIFVLIIKNKKRSLLAILFGLLLSAYFWLPALMEMNYTWAKEVATLTNFRGHFLCVDQLWQSSWGFGGSTSGCINDGMSFMIGKIQLILFGLGVLMFLKSLRKPKYDDIFIFWFLFIMTFIHLFLTTYQSKFIWEIFAPISSVIQFPWRLIGPPLLGITFFSTFFLDKIKIPFKNLLLTVLLIVLFIVNGKYFKGQEITKNQIEKKFLSREYIEIKAAYAVAEYLPKTIDYKYWRSLEKKKSIPLEFFAKASIEPFDKNKETGIEKIGNIVSLLTFILLFIRTVPLRGTVLEKKHGRP